MIIRNTLGYNFVFIVFGTIFAVAVAIILNEIRANVPKKIYQVFILIPYLVSMVVVSYIAFAFLSTDNGFINNSILHERDQLVYDAEILALYPDFCQSVEKALAITVLYIMRR